MPWHACLNAQEGSEPAEGGHLAAGPGATVGQQEPVGCRRVDKPGPLQELGLGRAWGAGADEGPAARAALPAELLAPVAQGPERSCRGKLLLKSEKISAPQTGERPGSQAAGEAEHEEALALHALGGPAILPLGGGPVPFQRSTRAAQRAGHSLRSSMKCDRSHGPVLMHMMEGR